MISFLLAVAMLDEDRVSLARSFMVGERDVYAVQLSPEGRLSPLGNPQEISIIAAREAGRANLVLTATPLVGSPGTRPHAIARWIPDSAGVPVQIVHTIPGFEFFPWAFVQNASSLGPNQAAPVKHGSVRLIWIKDSVAQVKAWVSMEEGSLIETVTNVEIPSRRPNRIEGRVYRQKGDKLTPLRAFLFERIRTRSIEPIPQEDDGV